MRLAVFQLVVLAFSIPMSIAFSQQQGLGPFEARGDIGPVKHSGSVAYDSRTQNFTIAGSGSNMWFDHDECCYLWKRLKSNFILQTEVKLVGDGIEPHRKLGWMVRKNLEPNSPYVDIAVHGNGRTSLQFRGAAGDQTEEISAPIIGPSVIQLERQGNRYTMSVAWAGSPYTDRRSVEVELGDEVYAGIYVCAHNADVVERGEFRNVRVVVPAADDFVPYRDYIGSKLEILYIESGNRTIAYESPDSIQAPNWTPDGGALIYNAGGRLYRFDLTTNTPTVIDTGFATRNNNDHVLSFDGKMLGISHHSEADDGKSLIYTLPVGGGTPRQVTPLGPSYLHGWSPDGSWLVYTGDRNGNLDIYKTPVGGGDEIRLTNTPSLEDGPEYSPDGRWIYFNSSRTGRMQLWRMSPDGADPEQVTNDEFNNWFPHISPDGAWIAFLSFGREATPEEHPFYKPVYLRLMPAAGGEPKVIAYVYGGQGTINVPSWSPDGKRIAFVSNTAED